jgi:Putative glucoamylase/Protein of unknown function (DUF3131)
MRLMNQRRRLLPSLLLVIFMTLIPDGFSSGREVPETKTRHDWDVREREELLRYALATWHSVELMAGPNGLPSDGLLLDDKGEWKPSKRASPTDIASYLWSTLAARALGLIDDAEADRRLGATLATLGRMERDHGFFFNLCDVETGAKMGVGGDKYPPPRPFLSSVDNGWLAAGLMMVRNARPALRGQADALLGPMDFGFFYVPFDPADPVKHPGHFHGGYYTDDGTFTAFYGMLNTEPRIISYIAIARRQVPPEHYYRLFRTLPADRGRQRQVPRGVIRSYLGVPVFEGHYEYRGLELVSSWGGSMFEALMVPLFVPEEAWAPGSWGVNHRLYVRAQIEQGLEVRRYGFWGFSPSWAPEGGYQTYGMDELGTEVDGYRTYEIPLRSKPKGGSATVPAREGVVTPHATFLALRFAPEESLANLRSLIKAFPILGPQGFHDSVNVTTGEVSRCVLVLDQGMILAAIANVLADEAIRRAFSEGPIEGSIRPLISPEIFTAKSHQRSTGNSLSAHLGLNISEFPSCPN